MTGSDFQHTFPSFQNEIFREHVQIFYFDSSEYLKKIIIGRVLPKPEILILTSYGVLEDHIKLNDLSFNSIEDNSVVFEYTLDITDDVSKKIVIKVSFFNSDKRQEFLDHLRNILMSVTKDVKIFNFQEFKIKKVNRFKIKQNRIIWLSTQDNSFNISEPSGKKKKSFNIMDIKQFVKTTTIGKIIVEFYEKKHKTLTLIFSSDEELRNFLASSETLIKIHMENINTTQSSVSIDLDKYQDKTRRYS